MKRSCYLGCMHISLLVPQPSLTVVFIWMKDIDTDENQKRSVFPHLVCGIPFHVEGVVTNIYKMRRGSDSIFLSIDGLVD